MKIAIITLHSAMNYGSMLQAYALQQFLLETGNDVEIIDYRPYYVESEGNKIKEHIKRLLFFKDYMTRKRNFNSFIKENMIISKMAYETYHKLVTTPPDSDCYITGSDQLWNLDYECGRDNAYYLDFVKSGCKMSYAVSAGKSELLDYELDWIYTRIKDFDWISVREKSTKAALQERGVTVNHVCDPVLLLDRDHYVNISTEYDLGEYIVIYLVRKSKLLDEFIEFLRDNFNYKIILVGGFTKRCDCDIHIKDAGPKEFLGLLNGAEYIVASSFHAMVFAHLFKKRFVVILPERNSARIEDFLSVSNTLDRIVRTNDDFDRVLKDIDYKKDVDPRIGKFIEASKKGFVDALNNR